MMLETPVTQLPAVHGRVARGLERLGIRTVRHLLFHFPTRHEDRRTITPIGSITAGSHVVVRGTVKTIAAEEGFRRLRGRARRLLLTRAVVADESGELPVVWFHQRFLEQRLAPGTGVFLAGTVNEEGTLVMPEAERVHADKAPLHMGRLVPVYPETAGVTSRMLRYLVSRALPAAVSLKEYLPISTREEEGLADFPAAVAQMHFPDDDASLARSRTRLSFDELLLLQLAALVRRSARGSERARAMNVSEAAVADAVRSLPFRLTSSQEEALRAILADLARDTPMVRLLAGDVGSGKTVVAGLAALAVARAGGPARSDPRSGSGGQTALLAPTEILAQQHAATLNELLGSAGLRVSLLTAATPSAQRAACSVQVARGEMDLVVGTQALLHATLRFNNLALVVVDEQHRFGVRERSELTLRGPAGETPHFLSLSATPIPRTLQLTAYGDVDVSPLDPRPGQQVVKTEIVPPPSRNTMYATLKNRVAAGGQVFVVCPRVEAPLEEARRSAEASAKADREGLAAEMRSVESEYRRLKRDLFRELRIERLHGKLPAEEKVRVIDAFRNGSIDLLVASTVVEVGVDIPNADTLLVEGAERFGLATLHQLRGRIGRRGQAAACFLATETEDAAALERLKVLVRTSNGLEIAEEDLRRRGPGEMYGVRQHGGVALKVASLADLDVLLRVRSAAEKLLRKAPNLEAAPLLAARVRQLNVTTHFE